MTKDEPAPDLLLDTRGMFCPIPVIKLSEAMRNIDQQRIVELVSDDPEVDADLEAWCHREGHTIVATSRNGKDTAYRVRKTGE